jgi:glucokinase
MSHHSPLPFDADRDRIKTAYWQASERADFRGGFLARSSHELRSPLNQVISLHQMILEDLCDSPEEEREFVGAAHAAALKMLEHLDFLIYLSKLQAGVMQPTLQPVGLSQVFEQVKTLTHLQAANRNLPLVVTCPEPDVQVLADPQWLVNGLVTLIEVAIAAAHRGPLRLSVGQTTATHCHLWLEDDRPETAWQEPNPLPDPAEFDLDRPLPLSLRHDLAAALFAAMGGHIKRLDTAATDVSPAETWPPDVPSRLQCTLPLVP